MNCHYVITACFCLGSCGLPPSILFCSLLKSIGGVRMPFGHILQVSASSREKPVFYSHGHIFYHPYSPPDLYSEL